MTLRVDLALIADRVAPGSRVLDLGCGDGSLLAAEFVPPPEVRDVRSEGIRYRVLKQAPIGSGVMLPVQVLLDGLDLNGSPTGHVRVTKMQITVRGPYDPKLFLHPVEIQAMGEKKD